jgi:mandelate racemase
VQANLTVRALRATPVNVPLRRPVIAATGSIPFAPLVLVDLETGEGITGRCYLMAYSALLLKPLAAIVESLTGLLKGDNVAPAAIEAKLMQRLRLAGTTGLTGLAIAAVDMCAWDAVARAMGLPLARILGGECKAVPAYNSCGLWLTDEQTLPGEAEELLSEGGFHAVKIRLGRDHSREDLAAVRAVQQRVGSGVRLMADFNQKLSVNEAILRGRELDGEGLYWIEEPVRFDDVEGCARVCAELRTPVQSGENWESVFAMQGAIRAQATDYVMPDVQRIGGVSGWLRAAAVAHAQGTEMSSHLFPEYSVHLLAVTPTAHYLEFMDWAAPILVDPLEIRDGKATVPDRPGAGINWNKEAVRQYRVE